MMSHLCNMVHLMQFERSKLVHKYFWSYIILNFSAFYKELTVDLTVHVKK